MEPHHHAIIINTVILLVVVAVMARCQLNEVNDVREQVSRIQQESSRVQQELLVQIANLRNELGQSTFRLQEQVSESLRTTKTLGEQQEKTAEQLKAEISESERLRQQALEDLQKQVASAGAQNGNFQGVIAQATESVVNIKAGTQVGSGIIISDEGLIVTNYHLVQGVGDNILVTLPDGRRVYAVTLEFDEKSDLALVRPKTTFTAKALSFGDSDAVSVGDHVVAIGNPGNFKFSASQGIISSVDRKSASGTPLFQIDVSINPGNSGGPLLNANGEVIGINVGFMPLDDLGLDRIGFAIQSSHAKNVTDTMRKRRFV